MPAKIRNNPKLSPGAIIVPRLGDPRNRYRFIAKPLQEAGVTVKVPDARSLGGLWRSLRMVAAYHPAVLVLVGAGPKAALIGLVARFAGNAVVLRFGGDPRRASLIIFQASWRAGALRMALRAATQLATLPIVFALSRKVIVVNRSVIAPLRPQARRGTHFHVVPQPCFGLPERRAHKAGHSPILLTVTNLRYPQKAEGVLWQIGELAQLARDTGSKMVLRVAGDGQFRASVDAYLATERLPPNFQVELLGFRSEIQAEYREADVFLYRSEHDATPNVLLEAKRYGLPVVVNDFPPFRSVVADGISGFVYHDGSGFRKAVGRLLQSPALRTALAEGGHAEFIRTYTPAAVGTALAKVLTKTTRETA